MCITYAISEFRQRRIFLQRGIDGIMHCFARRTVREFDNGSDTKMRQCMKAFESPLPASPGVPMLSADRPATRLATRLAFLVPGFGIARWAPLVPFAKTRLGGGDGGLGARVLRL